MCLKIKKATCTKHKCEVKVEKSKITDGHIYLCPKCKKDGEICREIEVIYYN